MGAALSPQETDASLLSDREDDAASTTDAAVTVFRAYERREFREWPGWKRVRNVLASNGGSYGLSGPRGSGKTWLMLRAVTWARGEDEVEGQESDGDKARAQATRGLGLWYPSPSEYEPLAFLASLTDSLAAEIKRRYRAQHSFRESLRSDPLLMTALPLITAVLSLLVVFAWSGGPVFQGSLASLTGPLLIGLVVGLVTALVIRLPIRPRLRREQRLLREARLAAERARYSATRRETAEAGAEAGRGVVGRFRTSRERELVERPATLSSLVTDFRALAEQAGEVAGRVVIAIDELDKMDDPEKVRALLRDIKGVFEVPRVHFFVSVSDEAARSLNLGALTGRDEFNSSFYTVIELPPATPEACAELLQWRARIARDVALALAILAGGNPREVVRLADLVGDAPTAAEAVMKAVRAEALSLRNQIVTSVAIDGATSLGAEARVGAFDAIPEAAFESATSLAHLASTAVDEELFVPPWRDEAWDQRFAEAWQRLLIRLAVAGEILSSSSIVQDRDAGLLLQNVIVVASQSAQVARIVLDRRLQVEAPDVALGVEQRDARDRVEKLARQYEDIRAGMKSGNERTAVMTNLVSEVRSLARDCDFQTAELIAQLNSNAAGDRIVALGAIEATGDHGTLDAVLEALAAGRTPFEQYHAFQALESIRPSLSEDERARVLSALDDPALTHKVGWDTDRANIHARVLAGLAGAR